MHAYYLFSSLLFGVTALAGTVLPGIPWYDTDGQLLQAHGGGIVQEGDTFYLIGENKTSREGNEGGNSFNSVAVSKFSLPIISFADGISLQCYQSKDLIAWEFVNDLLVYDPSIPDLGDNRVIERPKVVHSPNTNQYVMWMHVDSSDYKDAKAGAAVSDSLCGDFSYKGSVQPLDNQSRDMTLFVDNDDTGYLVGEDRDEGTHFFKLSSDYLTVEEKTGTILFSHMPALESPAVVKVDGVYYFFGSQLTGWDPVSPHISIPLINPAQIQLQAEPLTESSLFRMRTNSPPLTASLVPGQNQESFTHGTPTPAVLRRHLFFPSTGDTCTWATAGSQTSCGDHSIYGFPWNLTARREPPARIAQTRGILLRLEYKRITHRVCHTQ